MAARLNRLKGATDSETSNAGHVACSRASEKRRVVDRLTAGLKKKPKAGAESFIPTCYAAKV